MLFEQKDRLAINGIILTSLLTLLSGCGNSAALEGFVGADPQLTKKAEEVSLQTQNPAITSPKKSGSANNSVSNTAKNRAAQDSANNLTQNFTQTFPVYPQAELVEAKSSQDQNSGMMLWKINNQRQDVASYYQEKLSANGWDVIKPFTINPQQKIARAIAVKDNLRVELSLLASTNNQTSQGENSRLSVVYHPLDQDIPQSSISQWAKSSEPSNSTTAQQPTQNQTRSLSEKTKQNTRLPNSKSTLNQNTYKLSDSNFEDLNEVPPQLQQPIESVAALGILTPYTRQANVDVTKFAPNQVITRGEYARWLIAANNRYYADNPGKKIYLATKTSQPAFNDINPKHPDFAAIQSLAEAGLIPSRLTEDSTNLLFRPDAPLTRADLVTWKVPLDTRKSLPKASIQAIEESWGFQDTADIDSSAIRALYDDFQNGDRSNVRRIFGYTTLFQPKKPVTRAEAAASLWYFGFQGDGITAKEVLASAAKTKS
ncbi:MAG: hypothetical protein RLZZ535_2673 [Cyanobacteriota bacterium]